MKPPKRKRIGDKTYRPVVLIVRTRNEDGTPGLLEHLRDDDVAHLDKGETDFVIVYMSVEAVATKKRKR